jgi:hypothetical protein
MPATIHKLLVHGSHIKENAPLPIGQLSEEAQEARDKDFKRVRENYTRKISRIATNEDELNVFNYRKYVEKSRDVIFFEETINLFKVFDN